jgi:hypothetical protein
LYHLWGGALQVEIVTAPLLSGRHRTVERAANVAFTVNVASATFDTLTAGRLVGDAIVFRRQRLAR